MSTSAKSLLPAATRAIASGDPLATLVVTARPSEENNPAVEAITNGAAPASSGRSSESWIATGGRVCAAARSTSATRHATTKRPVSKAVMRAAIVGFWRIELHLLRWLCLFHDVASAGDG